METFAVDWLVLAQTTETGVSAWSAALDSLRGFATVAIVALVLFGLPVLIARWLTRSVFRMGDDYIWRVALVLSTVFCAIAILWPTNVFPKSESWRGWPPKLGIDLQGGVILVYEMVEQTVDPTNPEAAAARISVEDLVEPLRRRLDPGGIKEIVVRPYGQRQIEIIIPEVEAGEVEQVKKTISTAGHLQFRILVDAMHAQDERHVNAALDEANRKKDLLTIRVGDNEEPLAQWMRIARDDRAVRIQAVEVPDPKDPSKTITIDEIRPLKFYPSGGNIVRDAETFEIVNLPYVDWEENKRTHQFERNMLERGIGELEVLVRMDDRFNVEGGDLEYATSGFDDRGGNAVHFNMTALGAQKMARLTSTHLPISERDKYQMGIILDDEVLSAPTINDTISDRGMISGSFTDEEVTFLVRILQGGRLPASLNKSPISQNRIDPLLGEATIRSSMISMVLAMAVTLLFIIFWYRAAGLIASVALLLNLAFTLGLMVLFSVALSLPGVAGLILSVGMSVDANILIFERMREERLKGSSFRLAIRNGFSRASTTIIDSNLTTLITAFVLYFIGTDQLKGFAITLILGIVTSMFTAIFVARLIFEICERRGWLTDIYAFAGIQKWLVEKGINFVRLQTACGILSLVLTIGALVATVARGSSIFDIDFSGGTSVVMLLDKPIPQNEVDAKLRAAFSDVRIDGSSLSWSVTQIGAAGSDPDERGSLRDRLYKVDSSFPSVEELEKALGEALTVDGQPLLASYSMNFTQPEQTTKRVPVLGAAAAAGDEAEIEVDVSEAPASGTADDSADDAATPAEGSAPAAPEEGAESTPAPSATESSEGAAPATPEGTEEGSIEETTPPAEPEPGSSVDAGSPSAYFVNVLLQEEQPAGDAPASETPAAETPAEEAPATETPAAEAPVVQPPVRPDFAQPPAGEAAAGEEKPAAPATREIVVSTSKVTMENAISAGSLIDRLVEASTATGETLNPNEIDLLPVGEGAADWNPDSELMFREWQVTLERPADQTLAVMESAKEAFASDFVFPSSSEIGSQVAGKTKTMAAFALLFSLIGIILYIWFRFHRVLYGVAAVIALVHTVIVTLGAVAVSYWLARYVPGMRLLGIDEFKISLAVIAAFLTLIGYAINDTIVVFDRIREVRGKAPYLNADMINLSVNSTLSRTLLTSVTILASLIILYFMGGEGIHGFAFVLIVGILVGTYSSIFIASPVLLWMSQRADAAGPSGPKKKPAPKTA